jgi:hypothetical protein
MPASPDPAPAQVLHESADHLPVEPPDRPGGADGDPRHWDSFLGLGWERTWPEDPRETRGSAGLRRSAGTADDQFDRQPLPWSKSLICLPVTVNCWPPVT